MSRLKSLLQQQQTYLTGESKHTMATTALFTKQSNCQVLYLISKMALVVSTLTLREYKMAQLTDSH